MVNILKSKGKTVLLGSCVKSDPVSPVFDACTSYVLDVYEDNATQIIDPLSVTSVTSPIGILGSKHLDIFVIVFPKFGVPSIIKVYTYNDAFGEFEEIRIH